MNDYQEFINRKTQLGINYGFSPIFLPDYLIDFQKALVEWSLRKGRGALFADCGLGKTIMQLVWAQNIVEKENKNVLILTPLAVSTQTIREGEKFGIKVNHSREGKIKKGITVTNYERLHYFNPNDFIGVACDESSILKNFDGTRKAEITDFMRKIPYRLLCTATAAPNDFNELGTSSEALGNLGCVDMLNRFFKNDNNNSKIGRHYGEQVKWRLKGHAEDPFWRWVCSWARAVRKPSDLGFDDTDFILPPLVEHIHDVKVNSVQDGRLFALPALNLFEQREENRRSINERCEMVSELVKTGKPVLVWCHLNAEGDLLKNIIPDAVQISGSDTDEKKESKFLDFINGNTRVLVTKPKIGAWGLNFQHCSHITYFPSHSFEQYYQGVRRCWRFGQKNSVKVDIVTTEGGKAILANLQRKAKQADQMFDNLIAQMNNVLNIKKEKNEGNNVEVPEWLKIKS